MGGGMMLDISMINKKNGLFRYYTNVYDAEATMDLVRFYSPYGTFKRNYSYFGPGGILQMYASFTENYGGLYFQQVTRNIKP